VDARARPRNAGRDAASGDLEWEYRRSLPSDLGEYFPVSSINRNLAIYADTIVDTSADDYVFALDARTGELRWETKIQVPTNTSPSSAS
jgi:alcohol dehydrogenase (cytochrome c)